MKINQRIKELEQLPWYDIDTGELFDMVWKWRHTGARDIRQGKGYLHIIEKFVIKDNAKKGLRPRGCMDDLKVELLIEATRMVLDYAYVQKESNSRELLLNKVSALIDLLKTIPVNWLSMHSIILMHIQLIKYRLSRGYLEFAPVDIGIRIEESFERDVKVDCYRELVRIVTMQRELIESRLED